MPTTVFPMRGGLPQKEPEIIARWKQLDLYKRLRQARKGRGPTRNTKEIEDAKKELKVAKDKLKIAQQDLDANLNENNLAQKQ